MSDISAIRKEYKLKSFNEEDAEIDPVTQFRKWWTDAIDSSIDEVNAMTLATVDESGKPSARIVLLKGFDGNGFSFFTNYNSRKAEELAVNKNVSLVFYWKELERQVRIEGIAEKMDADENNSYFQSRPRDSRIGAWASPQSNVISGRQEIEQKVSELTAKFEGSEVDCPPFWGGYMVKPVIIEFWQGRPGRLHDRIRYRLADTKWIIERLAP